MMNRSPADELEEDIIRTWGPYSKQASTYRSLIRRLKNPPLPPIDSEPYREPSPPSKQQQNLTELITPSYISKSAFAFYGTRFAVIFGVWAVAIIAALGFMFLSYLILF